MTPQLVRGDRRRTRITDLYVEGVPQFRIVEILKAEGMRASQSTVSRELVAVRREWRERRLVALDVHQEQELARIDRLERDAWERKQAAWKAWKASQDEQLIEEQTASRRPAPPGPKGAPAEVVEERAKQRRQKTPGDPRYLTVMNDADLVLSRLAERRCRILGLYAPQIRTFRGDEAMRRLAGLLQRDPKDLPE